MEETKQQKKKIDFLLASARSFSNSTFDYRKTPKPSRFCTPPQKLFINYFHYERKEFIINHFVMLLLAAELSHVIGDGEAA